MNAFDLKSIAPAAGARFSPNLHSWMKKHFPSTIQSVVVVPRKGERRELWIGIWTPDGFIGCRLSKVLCFGAREGLVRYSKQNFRAPLKTFWPEYLRLGRCHIDQHHRMSFLDERWSRLGDRSRRRECTWCGLVQVARQKKRVVVETVWEAA